MSNDQQSNFLDWAIWYAKSGFRVFPIRPQMKSPPLIEAWPDKATDSPEQIREWWTQWPDANIGIATGGGWTVLDIDPRHGGPQSLVELEKRHGVLPATKTARTPSGGEHRYFAGEDVGNSTSKIGPGLDIKSRRGYVVAAPSCTIEVRNEKGEVIQHAGRYELPEPHLATAPTPPWLISSAGAPAASSTTTASPPQQFKLRTIDGEQLVDLTSALDHLSTVPEVAGNALWSEIGYALLSLGDHGREIWCDWGTRAPGYMLGAPEHWWASHNADRARSDYRHVFTIATRHGWINPRSRSTATATIAPPAPPTTPTARFTPIDAWEFADGPDPSWRIEGLLPEQGLAMVYGASGSGKSFFTLDMMMAIVLGAPYGHEQRPVIAGRVVYIVAEGAGGFRKRLRAYRAHHKLQARCPAPKLVTAAPNLMNAVDVSDLTAAILAAGGADVVVADTLHASTAGADENSAQDMGQLLGNCRALQVATGGLIVLIHHSGKDQERGARGSSAIRAAMDTEIEVMRADGHTVGAIRKQRDADEGVAVCFRLVTVPLLGSRPTTSAAVEHIAQPAKARKARTSEAQSLVVDQVRSLGQRYPAGVQLEVLAAAIQTARPDMRHDSIKRSITRAIDGCLLTIDSSGFLRSSTDNLTGVTPIITSQHR